MRAVVLACAGGALLAAPAVASAATKSVFMGIPPASAKAFQKQNLDVNDYFPHSVTVHAGDSVRFVPAGFHTVDIPARGASVLPLFTPGAAISGANDAAGNPFWFNGQPSFGFNSQLVTPGFGKSFTYSGGKRITSGLPLANRPKPMTVKFPKPGTYTFYCNVHRGMKGIVHVVGRSARVPSAKVDARTVKNELASDLKAGKRLALTRPSSGIVKIGASATHGVESYAFYPSTTKIPVGTTLIFQMAKGSTEDHTATTGPGDINDPKSYIGALSASFQSPVFAPAAVYASEPPGGAPASLTPSLHGNGFWSSGVLDTAKSTPIPSEGSVKFTAPGTYTFHCLIHPFMKATVTVE